MTHIIIDEHLESEIEARRYDIKRTWPDNLERALQAQLIEAPTYARGISRAQAVMLIAQLTLAIENGVIA